MKKAELEKENLKLLEQVKTLQENIKALRTSNEKLMEEKMTKQIESYLINIIFVDGDINHEIKLYYNLENTDADQIQNLIKTINEYSSDTIIEMYKKLDVYPENEGDEDGKWTKPDSIK